MDVSTMQGSALSPEQARIRLERSLERANQLLKEKFLAQEQYDVWWTNTFELLKAAYGEDSPDLYSFYDQEKPVVGNPEPVLKGRLTRYITFLRALVGELSTVDVPNQSTRSDFFDDIHPEIRRVSRQLFINGHYADSISAAFVELNHQVKQEYKHRRNVQLDGADLMHQAFSPNNPVFALADQSSLSGKDAQKGFMELFAGSMIGIRNPHSHEKYLASLLMRKFKAAL